MKTKSEINVRPMAAAGTFYPAGTAELEDAVSKYLSGEPGEISGIKAVLVPHAGYSYSGATAGAGFSAIKELDFDTAVILGTGHRVHIHGAALYGKGAFQTPLGTIEIDGELTDALLESSPLFELSPRAHQEEHSIEAQLPFLQCMGESDIKILPLLLNTDNVKSLEEIGKKLAQALKGKKAMLIISADLSHYPPVGIARAADASLMYSLGTAMRTANPEYFALAADLLMKKNLEDYDTACCGLAAVIAGSRAALELGAGDFKILKQTNSSETKGANAASTVGYCAGVFCSAEPDADLFPLSETERKDLLAIARQSIAHVFDKTIPEPPVLSKHPPFNTPAAAFVTLHKHGDLRGCIGSLEAHQTLSDCIAQMAKQSAFADPRFPDLSREELDEVDIEISVLSPMMRVRSADEVVQGKHGVFIRKGQHGGTYLPQVWEQFQTKEKFLNSLCAEKAGMNARAWKDPDTEIYVYTATIMAEKVK